MSLIKKLVCLILFITGCCINCSLAGSYLSDVPQCISVITSEHSKNGTLTSLHYPHPYPPKTHCRYDFVGDRNERVRLVFQDFNLYHPDKNSTDCGGGDVLSAFVYKDDQLARVEDYCGITTPPIAVMSNNNKLTLELNAPHSSRINRGFSALYSFVTDYGIETGRQDIRDGEFPCTFIYNSSVARNGTFRSPNHPGFYPRDTTCNYLFYGKKGERVDVDFTYFHIDGIQPCDTLSHSDYVEFSNYLNVDRKYDRQCGTLKDFKINSDNNFFRVTFKSNDRYDATGFQATYQFSDKTQYLKPKNYKVSSSASTIKDHYRKPTNVFAIIVAFSCESSLIAYIISFLFSSI